MALDAHEFIRRFLLHVLPDGFVKIRYAGLLGVIQNDPLPETWQESLIRISGLDVTLCPICHGKMRTTQVLRPLRGPP